MKGQLVVVVDKKGDRPLFCKLDARKKRITGLKAESSLLPSVTVELVRCGTALGARLGRGGVALFFHPYMPQSGSAVRADGDAAFVVDSKKASTLFRASSSAERDEWLAAIIPLLGQDAGSADAAAATPPPMRRAIHSSSSSSSLLKPPATPVQVRARSRSKSDPDIADYSRSLPAMQQQARGSGSEPGSGSFGPGTPTLTPRNAKRDALELQALMTFSARYEAVATDEERADVLLELAAALLEADAILPATKIARASIDLTKVASKKERAATLMQKAEAVAIVGSSKAPAPGWDAFDRNVMDKCRWLQSEREKLLESLVDKDIEDNAVNPFGEPLMARIIVPLIEQALAQLPKVPTKYALCLFECSLVSERQPYDGLNMGVLLQEETPASLRFFTDLLTLVELKLAQLGEAGPVLFTPSWVAKVRALVCVYTELVLSQMHSVEASA